jgi:small-conductance mechanosensitive channel
MIDTLDFLKQDLSKFSGIIEIGRIIVLLFLALVVLSFVLDFILGMVKRVVLRKTKAKKHITNVEHIAKAVKYAALALFLLFGIVSYTGGWSGFGISIGLFSAGLGLALQRPIMGIAAWIMIVTKRPFEIGDRISVQTPSGVVKGDVEDVSLTHVYIKETGGPLQGEDYSGRTVMIPNAIFFEQSVVNYTADDEFLLDEVFFTVTYDSNLDKAVHIVFNAAQKHTKDIIERSGKKPVVRLISQASGIDVIVRYYTDISNLFETSSRITKDITEQIQEARDVNIAYPHTEIIYKKRD